MALLVFCVLSLMLVAGKALRVLVPVLQRCYLPSSVIGGIAGLIIFQCFPQIVPAECIHAISISKVNWCHSI